MKGIVRKESNIEHLRGQNQHIAKSLADGQLEFGVVPDLTDKEVFEKALQGITAVIHLASPLANAVGGLQPSYGRSDADNVKFFP